MTKLSTFIGFNATIATILVTLLAFASLMKPLQAIQCIDDWTECSGTSSPPNTCAADSCAVSLVPVENCGSFVLRTCSVDFECHKSLSSSKQDFFNIKRVGPSSIVYDYCCTGADFCNNQTEAELVTKLCAFMKKNLPESDLAHHEVRRLCGLDVPQSAKPAMISALSGLTKHEKPHQLKPSKIPSKSVAPMKCACDLNTPGRFLECHMPSEETVLFGFANEEDVMPHCYSKDSSCSVFLTLDVSSGHSNGSAEIFRGCIDRPLPVSSCESAGRGGTFVEVNAQLASSGGPYVYEYCCNGDNFCNAVTIDSLVRKMCSWLKQRRPRPSAALHATTPASLVTRRTTANKNGPRTRQLNQREIRKNSLIYRSFCQRF